MGYGTSHHCSTSCQHGRPTSRRHSCSSSTESHAGARPLAEGSIHRCSSQAVAVGSYLQVRAAAALATINKLAAAHAWKHLVQTCIYHSQGDSTTRHTHPPAHSAFPLNNSSAQPLARKRRKVNPATVCVRFCMLLHCLKGCVMAPSSPPKCQTVPAGSVTRCAGQRTMVLLHAYAAELAAALPDSRQQHCM